jgi:hypothetical protein
VFEKSLKESEWTKLRRGSLSFTEGIEPVEDAWNEGGRTGSLHKEENRRLE